MKYFYVMLLLVAMVILAGYSTPLLQIPVFQKPTDLKLWPIQSIDTMKSSRDLAREKLNDPGFNPEIDQQIKDIASTGANYVAIDTPYDEEFLPILKRWVAAARKYHLAVWFRGNWSGWEGWFDYPKITRAEHIIETKKFILVHPDLFEDNDIFTPCPECENGGPGDPRNNNDAAAHRDFLRALYNAANQSFTQLKKKTKVGYFSMNGDVANLIMDKNTTRDLGGVVSVDHYIKTGGQLTNDLINFAENGNGNVVLGEFGAPIPDIHGELTPLQQANWLNDTLLQIAKIPKLSGLNYWVNLGGSTELWSSSDGTALPAVAILTQFYTPGGLYGAVVDELGKPINNASVKTEYRETTTGQNGYYQLPYIPKYNKTLTVTAAGYTSKTIPLNNQSTQLNVILKLEKETLTTKIMKGLHTIHIYIHLSNAK
ncbi:MAG: carboxypeptidase-like regulatory domain-containing protein [Patescibacteria group bacterium]|nr:carboxypeptidase-like regulatory domain-containing protein [Patescibacteria group bacterium]